MLRAALRCLPAYGEIQIAVNNSDWTVPDETGWKVGGLLQWLHIFVTAHATLYLIRPSRGFDVLCEALGADYSGDMTHDGCRFINSFIPHSTAPATAICLCAAIVCWKRPQVAR
jgi:hypothetical protein